MTIIRIAILIVALYSAYVAMSMFLFREPPETHEQMLERKARDHRRLGIK